VLLNGSIGASVGSKHQLFLILPIKTFALGHVLYFLVLMDRYGSKNHFTNAAADAARVQNSSCWYNQIVPFYRSTLLPLFSGRIGNCQSHIHLGVTHPDK